MKEITLGQSQNNDIIIENESVSRDAHLKIQIDNNGKIIINHHGRNDTEVNGIAIRKSILKKGDTITIGSFEIPSSTLITRINGILNKSKTDFTKEYINLISELTDFENAKEKIQKPSLLPLFLKASISLLLFAFAFIFKNEISKVIPIKDFSIVLPLMIIGGVIASYISEKIKKKTKTKQRLDDLELKYLSILKCPKCNYDLTKKTAYYLKQNKKCLNNKCDATFNLDDHT